MSKFFIVGGAGFIGSTLARRLLADNPDGREVVVYDNFSSGTLAHLKSCLENRNLRIVKGDVKDLNLLAEAMAGSDIVWHFASNPDIAAAMANPEIDFYEGTLLTKNVLEAIRKNSVPALVYASGSGVYGETGLIEVVEDYSPMQPISTYGASKLAGEAMISAYCHLYGLRARAYRFANVVGPMQTHGVGYDFIKRLDKNSSELRILGDGFQSKSYIHVDDVLDAIFHTLPLGEENFDVYNVATGDYITVNEIADLAISVSGLRKNNIRITHTPGDRGWKGDVPVIRFSLDKIHKTGWQAKMASAEALRSSMQAMREELAHE